MIPQQLLSSAVPYHCSSLLCRFLEAIAGAEGQGGDDVFSLDGALAE